ncbi:MAG: AIR synthase-related protein [Candidatus Omnitrophota bacterium]
MIQNKGNVSDKEMYTVFNMGIGMIVVIDKRYLKEAMGNLIKYNKAYVIGEIVRSKTKMVMM